MALTDNLVAYWKLDEASGTRYDSHGTNDLTDNNTVGSATGKVSNAADFEATNLEYLSHADNSDLSLGTDTDFTISCWVKLESYGGYYSFVGKDDIYGDREYFLYTLNQYSGFVVCGSGGVTTVNGPELSLDTWYFIVAWHDSSLDKIYIQVNNGTPSEASHTYGTLNGATEFRIGARKYIDGPAYMDGLIDEVGFWKRVLTGSEITELYNSGSGLAYPFSAGGAVGGSPLLNRALSPGHIFGGKCLC